MLKPVQERGKVDANVAVAVLSLGSRMSDDVVPFPVHGEGGKLPIESPPPVPFPVLLVANLCRLSVHDPDPKYRSMLM